MGLVLVFAVEKVVAKALVATFAQELVVVIAARETVW